MTIKKLIRRQLLNLLEAGGSIYVPFWEHEKRTCPICDFEGRFRPLGLYYVRPDAVCPSCESLERHRQLALFIENNPEVFSSEKEVLHFAPEPSIQGLVQNRVKSYTTTDLFSEGVDKAWNIEQIDCGDNSFDLILCSHVLEHVDTRKALSEMERILRPGGIALLMVPICEGLDDTYSDDSIVSEHGRWVHFQQKDHTRVFGRDFREMIIHAGFSFTEQVAQGATAVKYGLVMGERIFIAEAKK